MRSHPISGPLIAGLLAANCAALPFAITPAIFAQQPAPAPADPAGDMGFNFNLPPDWTVVAARPSPQPANPAAPSASQSQKKGTACIQVLETARHGDPASVIVIVDLPFDCFGQTMTSQDLAGFGSGALEGLKQAFDIADPVYGTYSLGSHKVWIERARGNPKGHSELRYTIEIACSLLKKGAVCWMAMAADEESLHIFENNLVTLDGEAAVPLVPATVFNQTPPA